MKIESPQNTIPGKQVSELEKAAMHSLKIRWIRKKGEVNGRQTVTAKAGKETRAPWGV